MNSNESISLEHTGYKKRLTITYRPPDSLIPDPKNPRHHPDAQIKLLMSSVGKYGFNLPILTDAEGNIISGHALVSAALRLGLTEIPTAVINHLSPKEIKALKIALNRLAEISEWNDPLLAETLQEIKLESPELLGDTGFSLDEIDIRIESLNIGAEDTPDPDDQLPAATARPSVSKMGDLWLLGQNRVLHGDTTNLADIQTLMDGKKAAVTCTDPPYGINYANSAKDKLRGTQRPILNDNLGEAFGAFLFAVCANILSVTEGAIYICMSSSALHLLQEAFVKAGGHWSTFIIWAKQTFTLGRADYQRQYEPILYGWREGAERYWCGARDQGDVWFINKPVKNDLHPTMKPVELVIRALRNSSRRGDIVLDPFLGSGTSLIAAERTGRFCYGLELDPQYVDTLIMRWQRHTGGQAIHAASGKTFDELSAMTEATDDAGQ